MIIKKLSLLVGYISLALSCPFLYSAHYVYLKNNLKETIFKHPTTGQSLKVGPAHVRNASLKKIADKTSSYDDYPPLIKPNAITWAASTPTVYDNCSDTATCQMWKLTFDVEPTNSQEAALDASAMRPIHLAPADDIEVVYTQPTSEDPEIYYGYIVYEGGDRFESANDTNSGIPSPVKPVVKSDGMTKFSVYKKEKPVVLPNPPDTQAPIRHDNASAKP